MSFPQHSNFDNQSSESARCTKIQSHSAGNPTVDFRGGGTDVYFDFDSNGKLTDLWPENQLPGQFQKANELIEGVSATVGLYLDSMKERLQEQGRDSSLLVVETSKKAFEQFQKNYCSDARTCLLSFLTGVQGSWVHPPVATFAIHNRYISNLGVEAVLLEPSEAVLAQAGRSTVDYAKGFQSIDWWNQKPTVLSPLHAKLVLANLKFTPILDTEESNLRSGDGGSLDETTLFQHWVRVALNRPVQVAYAHAPNGHSAVLVEIEDGSFAMIVETAARSREVLDPYHVPAPNPVQHLNREFTGKVAKFKAAAPAFLQQAALAMHLDPVTYTNELQFILNSVATCSEITPDMAAMATNRYNQLMFDGPAWKRIPAHNREGVTPMPEKYAICSEARLIYCVTDVFRKQRNRYAERGISFSIDPVRPDRRFEHDWRSAQKMRIYVGFTSLPSDEKIRANSLSEYGGRAEDIYGIVSAMIDLPNR